MRPTLRQSTTTWQNRQDDVRVDEIDWIFCWRTTTGAIRPGSRDSGFNGKVLRYAPDGSRPEGGLITIVNGRPPPSRRLGFLLNDQGALSRMGIFLWGYVTLPHVIPARSRGELEALREAAHEAVASGEAREWALAEVHTRTRVQRAIHVAAPDEVVRRIAETVSAAWILDVTEKDLPRGDGTCWVEGAEIVCRDLQGRELAALAANTWFDKAPVPAVGPEVPRPALGADVSDETHDTGSHFVDTSEPSRR